MRVKRLVDGAFLFQDVVLEASFFHRVGEEARLALAREADVFCRRLAERERRREIARAVVVQLFPARFIRRVARRVRDVRVDGRTICRDDAAEEWRRAHAALDLEREHAGLNELRDGTVHTHVFECELVRPRASFVDALARRLVDEVVRPAARLQAAAAVAALAEHDA